MRARLTNAPEHLSRGGNPWDDWQSPELVFSQTCGLPFRKHLHDRVNYVATPDYNLPDCRAGFYYSVVISSKRHLNDGPLKAAVNDPISQSGWAALHTWAVANSVDIEDILLTGAHAASLQAVATGQADLATLDAVTWRNLEHAHEVPDNVYILDHTAQTPGLPFICSTFTDPEQVKLALERSLNGLSSENTALLGISGLVNFHISDYLEHSIPPKIE